MPITSPASGIDTSVGPAPTSAPSDLRAPSKSSSEEQWTFLAGLRFLLAMTVLVTHVSNVAAVPRVLNIFTAMGSGTAVLGFFIVSGYSIAHSILRQARGFYERRFERIYPVYFACILLAIVPLALGVREGRGSIWTYVGQFFFTQGFLTLPIATLVPSWSLSLEVGYYALAPLFKRLTNRGLIVLIALSATAYVFRRHFNGENLVGQTHGISFVCLAWAWLLGFIAYRMRGNRLTPLLLFGLGITLNLLYNDPIPKLIAIVLSTALIVLVGAAIFYTPAVVVHPLAKKLLVFSGDISYPLYLCHPPIVALAIYYLHGASGVEIICLALASAAAIFFCVDLPSRKFFKAHRLAKL